MQDSPDHNHVAIELHSLAKGDQDQEVNHLEEEETPETRQRDQGATWPQFLAVFIVNINTFGFGCSMAWPAMALPQLQSANSTVADTPLTTDEGSWVAGLVSFGAIAGTFIYAFLPPYIGRKTLGYLVSGPLELGWALSLNSTSVLDLYANRILAGLNAGGTLILMSTYVSETASDEVRGTLGSMLSFMCNCGVLFGYLIGAHCSFDTVIEINSALPLLFAVGFYFVPETPYRLVSVGKREDAAKALRWLRRGASERVIEAELSRIEASLVGIEKRKSGSEEAEGAAQEPASLRDMLKTRSAIVGISIVVVLCANQMLCGVLAVLNYAVIMFHDAGSSLSPEISTIILGALQVLGNVVALFLMDRLGRRLLLLASNMCVALSISILGAYFYFRTETSVDVSAVGWLPVTCLAVYILATACGLGPLPYVVLSEVVAPRLRPLASLLGYVTVWLSGALIAKLYPAMAELFGVHVCFGFFAATCVAATAYGLAMMPETKGRSLEAILKQLGRDKDT